MIELSKKITLEGFTYLPGKWRVVDGNDAGPGEITRKRADKLLQDYPHLVSKVKPVEPVQVVEPEPFNPRKAVEIGRQRHRK